MKYAAKIQKIMVSGKPDITKSLNLYCPGAYTIKFVWYPIGVIKLADAPKQIAIKKALVGSNISFGETFMK